MNLPPLIHLLAEAFPLTGIGFTSLHLGLSTSPKNHIKPTIFANLCSCRKNHPSLEGVLALLCLNTQPSQYHSHAYPHYSTNLLVGSLFGCSNHSSEGLPTYIIIAHDSKLSINAYPQLMLQSSTNPMISHDLSQYPTIF